MRRATSFEAEYASKRVTAQAALSLIPSGFHISMGMAVAEPPSLLTALAARIDDGSVDELKLGGLAQAFGEYADRWIAYEFERDWKGFRRDTARILGILARRMNREERELYPLLENTARAAA